MTTPPLDGLRGDSFTVQRLLEMIKEGRIRMPRFQRPLRWQRNDHALLLDSLYRSYPIGHLLFWERELPAPAAGLSFGPLRVEAPETARPLWVVDGQQRLTSLAGCLLHPGELEEQRYSQFAFYFDLKNEVFHAPRAGRRSSQLDLLADQVPSIPVNKLADAVETSTWLDNTALEPALRRKAHEVGRALREYRVPAYILQAGDDRALRNIFKRSNTSGKPMLIDEVFAALNPGESHAEGGLYDELRVVGRSLSFGEIKNDILRKALICVAGHAPRGNELPRPLQEPDAARAFLGPTAEGLRRAIAFLVEAGMPHVAALPYGMPLVILPRFFLDHPEPKERSLELLSRWVWRGMVTRRHMVSNENITAPFKAFEVGEEEERVQRLLQRVRRTSLPPLELGGPFNSVGAATLLALSVLFTLQPRHLETGEFLAPQEALGNPGALPEVTEDHGRALGARLLHPAAPTRWIQEALKRASPSVLASHGFPESSLSLIAAEKWSEVIALRNDHLVTRINEVIASQTRWDEEDGPSLDHLLRETP